MMTLESLGQQRTHPTLSTEDGGRKMPPLPQLSLEGARLVGHHQEVEAALRSSSILPNHHAMLGIAFTKFRSAESGIMEVFCGLAKGFELSAF
jgi:hypothetical protein